MSEIRLNINGREVRGQEGQTVLAVARDNGIDIPTLCHDDRVKMYGSCGVCAVEAEGSPKLLRACSTMAGDGMVIRTDTERVRASRKTALELLLSDHVGDCRPPCVLACPGQTDCQGYVGLIANGEYHEALKLVKDKIPLPGSIGRVCPHPCEEACRRQLVEEPISIAALKAFVADIDMAGGELYTTDVAEATGKRVAVIGGGPGGLTAAYFLAQRGHEVTVYDAMPHMGGMLRYGIPEYRLPKDYLQREIDAIEAMGVAFVNNVRIGRDLTLEHLREQNDAVIVAVGAWTSTGLRCPGEELDGVVGGIDFLRRVALGEAVTAGKRVAVVGGGNTAMDACRTAVRLGAEKVYNIYRRTKNEMPAEEIEIIEAEEEGVIFKNLTNPIEVLGDGRAERVRLQIMELGEPDASGRRAPVPVEGAEETIEVDTVIVAIGQKLDPLGLEGVELTKWGTIAADEATFRTSLEGVFAVGDATNKGADIAISAIGEAKKAAEIVDAWLYGQEATYTAPYLVTSEPGAEEFADREKAPRAKMPHRSAACRRNDFLEVNRGLSEEEAVREAARCLECGCHDYFECKLIDYANSYAVEPQRLEGTVHHRKLEDDHPFIRRNPDKCILCGLCVRVCDEVVGATALGLVDRGFDTIVKPALDMPLRDTDCIACGQCVHVCPTGALTETMMAPKQVPVREQSTDTVCAFCSVGCKTRLTHKGGQLLRSLPVAERDEDALLCVRGRFGFGELGKRERLETPLLRGEDGAFAPATWRQAAVYLNKRVQALQSRYGKDAVAVTVSDRYTNEEVFLIGEYARNALHLENIYSLGKTGSGIAGVLGADMSTADFDELESTNLILLVQSDLRTPHGVAGFRVRRAVERGAKLIALNGFDSYADELAAIKAGPGEDLSLLRGILKAVMAQGKAGKDMPGYGELEASLAGIEPDGTATRIATEYLQAKKAVIVFEQDKISAGAAALLADIAVCAGHDRAPRSGILQLKGGANAQGLADLGVKCGDQLRALIADGTVKGVVCFGEEAPGDLEGLALLAVHELHMTETASQADLVLPARSFAEGAGTYTNTVGEVQNLAQAVESPVGLCNREQLLLLAEAAGYPLPHTSDGILSAALQNAWKTQDTISPSLVVPEGDSLLPARSGSMNSLFLEFAAALEKSGL